MRRQAVALAMAVLGSAPAVRAQSEGMAPAGEAPTAEEIVARAREVYTVRKDAPDPCATPVGNEIVVCREKIDPESQSVPSPTERANAAGERPPDPIPQAPYVLGLPECRVEVTCHRIGRAPPPIYNIDLSKIPEGLTPEEARRVFRAEDLPPDPTPEAASPTAAP